MISSGSRGFDHHLAPADFRAFDESMVFPCRSHDLPRNGLRLKDRR
jgi:hypothetical protein